MSEQKSSDRPEREPDEIVDLGDGSRRLTWFNYNGDPRFAYVWIEHGKR